MSNRTLLDSETLAWVATFTQPTTVSMLGLSGIMFMSQRYPDHFGVPLDFRGQVVFRVLKVERLLLPPLLLAAVGYGTASNMILKGDMIRGHAVSLGASAIVASWGLSGFRLSNTCTAIGVVYGTFGYYYNYKNILHFTDGAPWYNSGDFSEWWNS